MIGSLIYGNPDLNLRSTKSIIVTVFGIVGLVPFDGRDHNPPVLALLPWSQDY